MPSAYIEPLDMLLGLVFLFIVLVTADRHRSRREQADDRPAQGIAMTQLASGYALESST